MSEILSVGEAASILGFHEVNVRIAINRGLLRARKFGKRAWMISRTDFLDYVRNHPRPSRVAHVSLV